jgi:hypothetical protein
MFLKSLISMDNPMPSVIMARARGNNVSEKRFCIIFDILRHEKP